MQKQTSQFAVVTEKGSIKQVGRSTIWQPKTDYKGAGGKGSGTVFKCILRKQRTKAS